MYVYCMRKYNPPAHLDPIGFIVPSLATTVISTVTDLSRHNDLK